MADQFDLDKLKLKTSDELQQPERDFLLENRDKLNEEDEAAYSDWLPRKETTTSADGSGDSGDGSTGDTGNGSGGQGTGDAGGDGSSEPSHFFTTEEEARAFIDKQIEKREAKRASEAEAAGKTQPAGTEDTTPKWVDPEWKPADWNEGIQKAAEAALALQKQQSEAEATRVKANADRLENEWQSIAKEHSLPAIDTTEGRTIHDQIVSVALKHGKQSFPEAYELWSQIPEKLGGGFKIEASDAGAALAKSKLTAQKKAAGEVGGGSADTDKKGVKWDAKDLRSKSLDTLLEMRQNM